MTEVKPSSKEHAALYLRENVRPILHPLLAKACSDRPALADFPKWLVSQLRAEVKREYASKNTEDDRKVSQLSAEVKREYASKNTEDDRKVDEVTPSEVQFGFSGKVFQMLCRVQSKQQNKLTANDLEEVAGWLDEDSTAIDNWCPKHAGKKDWFTPICFAAYLGEADFVRLLLHRGSKAIDKKSKIRQYTPLYAASGGGHAATVALLLQHGSDVDSQNIDGWTSLHIAALFGFTEVARLVLQYGSQAIDLQNKKRHTPLMYALYWGQHASTCTLLCDYGVNRQGKTDLHIKAALGDINEVQRLLAEDSSDMNAVDASNATALDAAVFAGHREVTALLLDRGADRKSMSATYMASALGNADELAKLLSSDISDIDRPARALVCATPLYVGAWNGHREVVELLLHHGSNAIVTPDSDGHAPLSVVMARSTVRSDLGLHGVSAQLIEHGGGQIAAEVKQYESYASRGKNGLYSKNGTLISALSQTIRAYESHFIGFIRKKQGCACVASWPGIYAHSFDKLLANAKKGHVSAAVVFCPQHTEQYGRHSSDRCYCQDIYGRRDVEWGCKWFELWRGHIRNAVARGQRLRVYYHEGRVGQGKIESWKACPEDAIKRDSLWLRRQAFLAALPTHQKQWLATLSSAPRDDSEGEYPGSERGDAEEALFIASLSEDDRIFLEGHKGLGNSQKAEVAWLEKEGIPYEEADVRTFGVLDVAMRKLMRVKSKLKLKAKAI